MGNFSIDFVPLTNEEGVSKQQHFKEINAGAGTTSFGLNEFGMRMGAPKFEDAPFRLTYDGVLNLAGTSFEADGSDNLVIASNNRTFFFDGSNHYLGGFYYTDVTHFGLELPDSGRIRFSNGSNITDTGATLDLDRTLLVHSGDIALDTGYKFQIGTSPGATFTSGNVGGLFELNAVGGIVTYWRKY